MQNNIIEFGDRKFLFYRSVKDNGKIDADLLKKHWHCDTALKKDNIFYFCNEIIAIEFEEIEENENLICSSSM
jgi:hypothetical protein